MIQIETLKAENASLIEEVKRLREENKKVNEDFQKVVAQRDEMWEKVDAIQRKLDHAIALMEQRVIEKTLPAIPDDEIHNPDNVTEWGADEGYRLLFKSEVPGGNWLNHPSIDGIEGYGESRGWMPRMTGVDILSTYRTKLTPEQLAHARKWAK